MSSGLLVSLSLMDTITASSGQTISEAVLTDSITPKALFL